MVYCDHFLIYFHVPIVVAPEYEHVIIDFIVIRLGSCCDLHHSQYPRA